MRGKIVTMWKVVIREIASSLALLAMTNAF